MKRLLISLFALVLTVTFIPLNTFAQNQRTPQTTTLAADEVVENDYFVANDRVIISGTVNGDIYTAGGDVTFDGTVENDLLVAGGNVVISGNIGQDVRVAGGNVTFSSAEIGGSVTVAGGSVVIDSATSIGRSVTAMGGNIQLMSPITEGLTVVGGNVVVGGEVGGDVSAPGVGSLRLSNDASVGGDLTYTSTEDALIAQGATVSGEISRQTPTQQAPDAENIGRVLAGLAFALWISDLIITLLFGLAFVFFMPNFVLCVSDNITTRLGTSFLLGLLAIIVTPIVLLLLMLTLVGIPLALALLVIFFFVVWIAKIFGSIALGRRLLSSKKNDAPYGPLFLGVGIYFALSIIPILGGLIQAFITLSGLGGLFLTKKEYYNDMRKRKTL